MNDTPGSESDDQASASPFIPPVGATRTIATRDGRTLACLEVGDPQGRLVIHNHGGPSSRLEARLSEHFRGSYIGQLRKAVSDYDRQILARPGFETAFCEASAECFAPGSKGLVRDSELLYRNWAFDVTTIERRVHMWQGMDDRLVPASINKIVADRMPGAVWHPVEGAGHFVAIGSADELFAIAAEELGA